jgi:hypothetical protein
VPQRVCVDVPELQQAATGAQRIAKSCRKVGRPDNGETVVCRIVQGDTEVGTRSSTTIGSSAGWRCSALFAADKTVAPTACSSASVRAPIPAAR